MAKMMAISVRQPWANMIASGEKTIETRVWGTDYRGPLLIVSSKNPPIAPVGFALAICNLIECRPMIKTDEFAAKCQIYPGAYSWIFNTTERVLEPFPVKGRLGIFAVEVPW